MFAPLRRGLALVLGQGASLEATHDQLESSSVPVTHAQCRTCSDPCEDGHEPYPRFDVDMESQMLGSVKPYRRQIVISTGKDDWDRDIQHTHGSLASLLSQAEHKSGNTKERRPSVASLPRSPPLDSILLRQKELGAVVNASPPAPGIFNAVDSKKISILNGSHRTLCDDSSHETVLVFPDYRLITGVPRSLDGAHSFWEILRNPELRHGSSLVNESPFKSWVIPYSCVIMLCSHKKRDKRCSITAAKLEHAFIESLGSRGWTVDTHLEHPLDDPLDFGELEEDLETQIVEQLQGLRSLRKALIVRNSHIGGHRYAGNCIIYTPQGAGVWYGRVTTHEVESIVDNTIEEGKVLPKLLRGGVNLSRPGCNSLNEW